MNARINVKVVAVSMVIILILVTLLIMVKPVKAGPDKFYLITIGTTHSLTTTQPNGTGTTVTLRRLESFNRIWYSSAYAQGQTISEGTYALTYWTARRDVPGASNFTVYITFEFGHYKNGIYSKAWDTTDTFTITWTSPSSRVKTISYASLNIPKDAQLYLNVTISTSGMGGDDRLYFYYGGYIGGTLCDTNIETPTISVPEFPLGVFLLPLMLLTVYLVLRRCTPWRLRAQPS